MPHTVTWRRDRDPTGRAGTAEGWLAGRERHFRHSMDRLGTSEPSESANLALGREGRQLKLERGATSTLWRCFWVALRSLSCIL